jgi:hypothetical protein
MNEQYLLFIVITFEDKIYNILNVMKYILYRLLKDVWTKVFYLSATIYILNTF